MTPLQRIGKYEIRGVLGQGGVGTVYRAHQADLNRDVAVKVMIAGEHGSPELLKRFLREARSAAALSHPGIVPVHDVGVDGGIHYIVMELVEGRSLAELLKGGPLPPGAALGLAARVAEALREAHAKGVIHRDIKPSNILVDGRGQPRIADFGLASSLEEGERLTRTGDIMGTPWYMSPEQAFGDPAEIDGRADLYSLGAVLFEMLTGRPPFEGTRSLQVLKKIDVEDPPRPTRLNPRLDPRLDALVLRALEKDRERRYRDAAEFAEAIHRLRRDLDGPASARPRSRPVALAAGALVAVVAVSISAGYFVRGPSAPPPAAPLGADPELAEKGSVWRALRATGDGSAREGARRLYLTFLRYELCQGNSRIPYLRPVLPPAAEKDLQAVRSPSARPEERALGELVELCFQRRYREVVERAHGSADLRLRVVRAHAELRRILGVENDALRATRLKALVADLGQAPADRYVGFLLALSAAVLGEKARAEELALRLVDRASTAFSDPFLFRAVIFEHLDARDRLVESLELARAVDPEDPLPPSYLQAVRFGHWDDERERVDPFAGYVPSRAGNVPFPAPALMDAAALLFAGRLAEAEEAFERARVGFGDPKRWSEGEEEGRARDLARLAAHAGGKGPRFAYVAGLLLSWAERPGAEEALRGAAAKFSAPEAAQAYLLEPEELREMRQSVHRELGVCALRRGAADEAVRHLGGAVQAGARVEDLLEDERFRTLRNDRRVLDLMKKR